MLKYDILDEAYTIRETLIKHRRYIHSVAEVGFDLPKTVEYVQNELSDIGISSKGISSGVVATVGSGQGSTVLLRADMDAIRLEEKTEYEFASKNGNMHACGHDIHTAMLLGAARLLKRHESDLQGSVKLIFQPAEESLEGAKKMIEGGALEYPLPDAALMIHVTTSADIPVGTIVIPSGGVIAPSAEYFKIHVKGRGSHGASPKDGIDPITCGARILLSFEELSAREFVNDGSVVTVGNFFGGSAPNAIADDMIMEGTLRAYDSDIKESIKTRMSEIAEGISYAFGTKVDISFTEGCPAFKCDSALSAATKMYLTELFGKDRIIATDEFVGGGSEDFSYFAEKIPSVMIAISAGNSEFTLHHPKVRFDEEVLPIGAAAYAQFALRLINEEV